MCRIYTLNHVPRSISKLEILISKSKRHFDISTFRHSSVLDGISVPCNYVGFLCQRVSRFFGDLCLRVYLRWERNVMYLLLFAAASVAFILGRINASVDNKDKFSIQTRYSIYIRAISRLARRSFANNNWNFSRPVFRARSSALSSMHFNYFCIEFVVSRKQRRNERKGQSRESERIALFRTLLRVWEETCRARANRNANAKNYALNSGICTIDRESTRDIDTFISSQFERMLLIIYILIYLNLFISVDNPSPPCI